jgi:transcriptional regulator with XRE-family HTH domain
MDPSQIVPWCHCNFLETGSFAKKLNRVRLAERLTVKQLAERVGEEPEVLEKFEAGIRREKIGKTVKKPNDELIDKLNEVFPTASFQYAVRKKKKRQTKDKINPVAIAQAVHACCANFDQQGNVIDAVTFRKFVEKEAGLLKNELPSAYQPVIEQIRIQQNEALDLKKNPVKEIYVAHLPELQSVATPESVAHKNRKNKMLRRPTEEEHADFFKQLPASPPHRRIRKPRWRAKKSKVQDTSRASYHSAPVVPLHLPTVVPASRLLSSAYSPHPNISPHNQHLNTNTHTNTDPTHSNPRAQKNKTCTYANADPMFKTYLKMRKQRGSQRPTDIVIRDRMVNDGLADEDIDIFLSACAKEDANTRPVVRSIADYANTPPAIW